MTNENPLYFTKIGSILRLLADDLPYYGDHAEMIYHNWNIVQEVGI